MGRGQELGAGAKPSPHQGPQGSAGHPALAPTSCLPPTALDLGSYSLRALWLCSLVLTGPPLWLKVKEESEKNGLKLTIKSLRSWHPVPLLHDKQKGEKVEAVTDFIFLGSKIHCR